MTECEVCHRAINVVTDAHYQFVSGWAKARAKGTNAVHQQIKEERYRCATCIGKLAEIDGQLSLI